MQSIEIKQESMTNGGHSFRQNGTLGHVLIHRKHYPIAGPQGFAMPTCATLYPTIRVRLVGKTRGFESQFPYLFWHHDGKHYANASSRFKAVMRLLNPPDVSSTANRAVEGDARRGVAATGQQPVATPPTSFRPFRFHDLRHLFAVNALKNGMSIYQLSKHLGHSSIGVTEGYLKYLTPEEKLAAKAGTQAMEQVNNCVLKCGIAL